MPNPRRVFDVRGMPELIWATRRELAKVLRDQAEQEASTYVKQRLIAIANAFETGQEANVSDFLDDLADMFPDEIVGVPGKVDGLGRWVPSGAAVTLPAYVSGQIRMVRDQRGNEVASTVRAIVAGVPGFTPDGWRFTIPERFRPNASLTAIAVERPTDETGPCYEVVRFRAQEEQTW